MRLLHPGPGEAVQGLVKAQLAPPVPLSLLVFGYVWKAVFNLSTSDTANLCLKQLWLCLERISPGAQLSHQAPLWDWSCTILQLVSHNCCILGSQSQHDLPYHILCTLFSLIALKVHSIWNSVWKPIPRTTSHPSQLQFNSMAMLKEILLVLLGIESRIWSFNCWNTYWN